jgi:hypothetical protein
MNKKELKELKELKEMMRNDPYINEFLEEDKTRIFEIQYFYYDGYDTYFLHEAKTLNKEEAEKLARENAKQRNIFDNFLFLGFSDETEHYKTK